MNELTHYTVFKNKYYNQSCFIVGAGTSLNSIDLSSIHSQIVISINSSILLMPWHDGDSNSRFWISNDSLVRYWTYWDDVKKSISNKIVRDSWQKYFCEIPDFYQFTARSTEQTKFCLHDDQLTGASSIPSAVDFALQIGCKRIFILGLDQYFVDNKTHFFDYWEPSKQPKFSLGKLPHSVVKACYDLNNKVFLYLADFAQKLDAKIYNCNMRSRVDTFQKIDFIAWKNYLR